MTSHGPIQPNRGARTPPFLLLTALLFWGWQSGYWQAGAVMGIVLEWARFSRTRWEVTEEDFRRIRNFCALLGLALMVFIFSTNEQGGGLQSLLTSNAMATTRYVGLSATAFLRWLPIVLFLFVAAQFYSEREAIPLVSISWFFRHLRKEPGGVERTMDVSYAYFMVCLFSASVHLNEGNLAYFWGQAGLIAWALWPRRNRRFGLLPWALTLLAAVGFGLAGQRGLGALQRVIEGYNAQWLANMMHPNTDPAQSVTSIGDIGQLKLSSRIVLRLESKPGSPPPDYLREASYRRYTPLTKTWHAGSRDDFNYLSYDAGNDSAWTLVPHKTNSSTLTVSAYLNGRSHETGNPEGLLPLPPAAGRLENLHAFTLRKNDTGAVLASGLGLVVFDAFYGPGPSLDTAPDPSTNHLDLVVPANEIPALDRVVAELNIPADAPEDKKLTAVQQFFYGKFGYTTWLRKDKIPGTNETPLARFLLESRTGHCEYFATATVLLLRQLGIPARYAVGYYAHEGSDRRYVVRERDAHAWCLAWNSSKQTWENFDTTPPSWVAKEAARASATEWLSDAWSWLHFQISRIRWGQGNLREYILWALIPILALLLYQILFRRGRKRGSQTKTSAAAPPVWPGLDSEFYQLERKLAARGIPRQPGEPLSGWLARPLADPALAKVRQPVQNVLHLHYTHRFDPRGLSPEQRTALAREVKAILDILAQPDRRN